MAGEFLNDENVPVTGPVPPQNPSFFQRLMKNLQYATAPGLTLAQDKLNLQNQDFGVKRSALAETMRHNLAQEELTQGRTGAMQAETARKTEEDKWQRIGAAFRAANDIINHTDDTDTANTVLQSFFKDDPNPPIKSVQFSKKNKILQWKLDDGDFIINQPDFQKMMEAVQAGGDIRQGLQDAEGKGIGVFIKHGAKPKTEHEKVTEEQGAERIGIEKQKLGIEREKVKIQRGKEATTKFKEQKIAEMWDTLSDDERKKVIGAGIDPKELTEKDVLSIGSNLFTDPESKKKLGPVIDKMIQNLTQRKTGPQKLDEATAKKILLEAGGDRVKARKLAKERGFKF